MKFSRSEVGNPEVITVKVGNGSKIKIYLRLRREAMVQWLRQMAHDQEVVGSNPGTVEIMQAITLKRKI
jgi:hypothetical protein